MSKTVTIKGNKYGLVIYVDDGFEFEEAVEEIVNKFKECEKFYKDAKLGVTFEGKMFAEDEEREIVRQITENTSIRISCIIDNNKIREDIFRKSVEERVQELETNSGQFYKGTLRSGQVLESDSSVVILGDINPGAKVMAAGNVVVLGSLKGTVYAGISGNPASFIVALEMNPVQLRIGNILGRSADKPVKDKKGSGAKIAYVDDENIYIEPLNREVLNDIKLF